MKKQCNRRCLHKEQNWGEGFCGAMKDKPDDTFKCKYYQGTTPSRGRYGGPWDLKRGSCIGPFGE